MYLVVRSVISMVFLQLDFQTKRGERENKNPLREKKCAKLVSINS